MHYNNNYSGANPLLPRGFPLMKSELPFYSLASLVDDSQPNMAALALGLLLLCSKVLLQMVLVVQGTTHWMVTEDGRIQAQVRYSNML